MARVVTRVRVISTTLWLLPLHLYLAALVTWWPNIIIIIIIITINSNNNNNITSMMAWNSRSIWVSTSTDPLTPTATAIKKRRCCLRHRPQLPPPLRPVPPPLPPPLSRSFTDFHNGSGGSGGGGVHHFTQSLGSLSLLHHHLLLHCRRVKKLEKRHKQLLPSSSSSSSSFICLNCDYYWLGLLISVFRYFGRSTLIIYCTLTHSITTRIIYFWINFNFKNWINCDFIIPQLVEEV